MPLRCTKRYRYTNFTPPNAATTLVSRISTFPQLFCHWMRGMWSKFQKKGAQDSLQRKRNYKALACMDLSKRVFSVSRPSRGRMTNTINPKSHTNPNVVKARKIKPDRMTFLLLPHKGISTGRCRDYPPVNNQSEPWCPTNEFYGFHLIRFSIFIGSTDREHSRPSNINSIVWSAIARRSRTVKAQPPTTEKLEPVSIEELIQFHLGWITQVNSDYKPFDRSHFGFFFKGSRCEKSPASVFFKAQSVCWRWYSGTDLSKINVLSLKRLVELRESIIYGWMDLNRLAWCVGFAWCDTAPARETYRYSRKDDCLLRSYQRKITATMQPERLLWRSRARVIEPISYQSWNEVNYPVVRE